jgi:hypothetical protein
MPLGTYIVRGENIMLMGDIVKNKITKKDEKKELKFKKLLNKVSLKTILKMQKENNEKEQKERKKIENVLMKNQIIISNEYL